MGLIFLLRSLGDGLWIANNSNLCLSCQIGMVWDCVRFDDYYVTCKSKHSCKIYRLDFAFDLNYRRCITIAYIIESLGIQSMVKSKKDEQKERESEKKREKVRWERVEERESMRNNARVKSVMIEMNRKKMGREKFDAKEWKWEW